MVKVPYRRNNSPRYPLNRRADPLAGLNGFGGTKNLLHQPTIRVSIPGKARPSFPPRHPQRPWGQRTLLFTAYRGLYCWELKRPRSKDERSSRPSAHVKNKWSQNLYSPPATVSWRSAITPTSVATFPLRKPAVPRLLKKKKKLSAFYANGSSPATQVPSLDPPKIIFYFTIILTSMQGSSDLCL